MVKLRHEFLTCILLAISAGQAHNNATAESSSVQPRDDTALVPRLQLGSVPYGVSITNCAVPGTVALTFDDGPSIYTSELLDTLAANNIKATFFILGNRNGGAGAIDQTNSDIVKRIYREGHQIGSHTWDHQSLESLSSAQRTLEMTRNEAAFKNILGFFPTYMRPPYGFCYGPSGCLSDMGKLGYHVINWSIDTKDYENDSPTLIQNSKDRWDSTFRSANPQSSSFIPLTHDIHQQTVEKLAPYMIQEIKQKGYKFTTVGECLNDPPQNWYRDALTGQSVGGKAVYQASGSNNQSTTITAATSTSTTHTSNSTTSTQTSTSSSMPSFTHLPNTSTTAQTASSIALRLNVTFFLYIMLATLWILVRS